MRGQWFSDGVRFRCPGVSCGDCCSGKHGLGAVWVDAHEMEALAQHLGLPFHQFTGRFVRRIEHRHSLTEKPNGDCAFYEAGKGCTVYAARPRQCRTYPFWGRNFQSQAAWEAEGKVCPGINPDAPVVPAEEIRRNLDLDRERPADR